MAILIKIKFLAPTNSRGRRIKIQAVDDYIKYKPMVVGMDYSKQSLNQARELVQSYSEQYLDGLECSPIARAGVNTWYAVAGE